MAGWTSPLDVLKRQEPAIVVGLTTTAITNNQPPESQVLHPHPYAGARSATGILGFIANTSVARLYIPQRKQTAAATTTNTTQGCGVGVEGKGGRNVVNKVRNGILQSQKFLQAADPQQHPRILCIVYTVDLPKSRQALSAEVATWASNCDGFFAASNITEDTLGAVDLLHRGDESYGNMWQKVNVQAEGESG
jgi:glycoprotein-N-acetylgalactosamine 3-beta-galactosyltransferase